MVRIWNLKTSPSYEFRGAVYHMDTTYSTTNHPIPFNIEKINSGIEYNNGVFLILEPGYYRIYTHLKAHDNYLHYAITKNSREKLIETGMSKWDATSTSYMVYLALYDMIYDLSTI